MIPIMKDCEKLNSQLPYFSQLLLYYSYGTNIMKPRATLVRFHNVCSIYGLGP